ncbi:hypothetical protein SmJEL517_g00581 [Synchytrium microbalum]|uniref:RGS domain-containing protein n=1 Tax=Synchytrium microbalum TaxID=1806994 RepID=A0A507CHE9_9FUNG|nr:uncharacterized protein SmJEL517_g00581 [Synchytrium microbalum]TPX37454.1 hypothetical protein SmJEL517_g00581 [Synchytrium microbalum]
MVSIVWPARYIWPGSLPCAVELWTETILISTLSLLLVARLASFIPEYELSRRRLEISQSFIINDPVPDIEVIAPSEIGDAEKNLYNSVPMYLKLAGRETPHGSMNSMSTLNNDTPHATDIRDSVNEEIEVAPAVKLKCQTHIDEDIIPTAGRSSWTLSSLIPLYYASPVSNDHQPPLTMSRSETETMNRIQTEIKIHHHSFALDEAISKSNDKIWLNWWSSATGSKLLGRRPSDAMLASVRGSVAWKIKAWLAPKSLFVLGLIQAFMNAGILLLIQRYSVHYRIFPSPTYALRCARSIDLIVMIAEAFLYVVIVEPLIWFLGKDVKDEFHLLSDVFLSLFAGVSFILGGIIFAEVAFQVPTLRPLNDLKLWTPTFQLYAGALGGHLIIVLVPVITLRIRLAKSPEQSKSLSCSIECFNRTLQTPELFEKFKEFSVGNFSVENCLFVERATAFKQLIDAGHYEAARDEMESIFTTFIEEGSLCEINILGITRRNVASSVSMMRSCVDAPPLGLFDVANQEIHELLFRDTFSAYCKKKKMV